MNGIKLHEQKPKKRKTEKRKKISSLQPTERYPKMPDVKPPKPEGGAK